MRFGPDRHICHHFQNVPASCERSLILLLLKGYYHNIVLLNFWVVFDTKTRIATFDYHKSIIRSNYLATTSPLLDVEAGYGFVVVFEDTRSRQSTRQHANSVFKSVSFIVLLSSFIVIQNVVLVRIRKAKRSTRFKNTNEYAWTQRPKQPRIYFRSPTPTTGNVREQKKSPPGQSSRNFGIVSHRNTTHGRELCTVKHEKKFANHTPSICKSQTFRQVRTKLSKSPTGTLKIKTTLTWRWNNHSGLSPYVTT